MKTKFKHSKKHNTSFLYEVLILELAKSVVSKNKELRIKILETLKKYFDKSTILGRELSIYKSILNTKNVDVIIAEKILNESKKEYGFLVKDAITTQQNKLYFEIKKFISPQQIFSNFIPNYRNLASVSQIFNRDVSVKTRVLLENDIIGNMTSQMLQERKLQPIDNLVLNSFVKKFNEKYVGLFSEQKTLLSKFVTSFSDNGLELKIFLNEEIRRLKEEIKKALIQKEFVDDSIMLENGKKVLGMLESFSTMPINEQMIQKLIKIQNLGREINN